MNANIRKLFYKFKPLHRFIRCVLYNSDYFFYKNLNRQRHFDRYFKEIKNSCKGKRCFIIGNGPSLTSNDLDMLVNEDCFASNHIYKIFGKTKWRPKYYAAVDRYISLPPDLEKYNFSGLFIGSYHWRFNKDDFKTAVCLRSHQVLSDKKCKFSDDIENCVYVTSTVSYVLMQIAVYMGYSEIYLLGFDHNYSLEVNEQGKVIKNENVKSHYYSGKNDSAIADINSMTLSYCKMRDYCKGNGIVIKNATRGGKLEVFERVDFDSLLNLNVEI
ncbi:MAG: 6-hydroxymethylpterin diphosphokinase MptE-like protein [Oscillospiraceae bacterium]